MQVDTRRLLKVLPTGPPAGYDPMEAVCDDHIGVRFDYAMESRVLGHPVVSFVYLATDCRTLGLFYQPKVNFYIILLNETEIVILLLFIQSNYNSGHSLKFHPVIIDSAKKKNRFTSILLGIY